MPPLTPISAEEIRWCHPSGVPSESMRYSSSPLLLLALAALLGCRKTDTTPDPVPTPTPPVVVVTNPAPTPSEAVIYEVNLRAFQPAPTFAGVTARLDSIKSLGVNVLWLMPIHPVGVARRIPPLGSPYSISSYTDVNPEFGTLADFKALVAAAHTRGIAVVLDWVANHTAWDHPWITAHPEWYTHDASGGIVWPAGTNWQDVADLDFSAQPMRAQMIRALKYWVTQTGVDGYRCDAADYVPTDFWRQALDSLHAIPGRRLLMLAEGARNDHYAAGFQLTYSWSFYDQLARVFGAGQAPASSLFPAHDSEMAALPAGARKLRFTTNHDKTCWEATPLTVFGGVDGALAASVITVGLGQTPLVYSGQEVGCPLRLPLFDRSAIDWSLNPAMAAAYRRLLRFYRAQPAVQTGTLYRYPPNPDVLTFKRTLGAAEVLVIVNVRNRPVSYPVHPTLAGTTWTEALPGTGTTTLPATLALPAFGFRVLRR